MKKLKTHNIQKILIILVVMLLSGCSITNQRLNMLNETSQTERESINQIEKTVIKALDTKDRNLIKSLFSKRALKYAADIDEGIDYMFQIYEGQFKEKISDNYASDMELDAGKKSLDYSAWYEFATTKGKYRLDWSTYVVNDFEPDKTGLKFLRLRKQSQPGSDYFGILGVAYPKRMHINQTLAKIADAFEGDTLQPKAILDVLSTRTLQNPTTAQNVQKIVKKLDISSYADFWVENTDVNGRQKQNVYAYIKKHIKGTDRYKLYILYFNYDPVAPDKISVMKLTQIDHLKHKDKYQLGDDITTPGVYLSE